MKLDKYKVGLIAAVSVLNSWKDVITMHADDAQVFLNTLAELDIVAGDAVMELSGNTTMPMQISNLEKAEK